MQVVRPSVAMAAVSCLLTLLEHHEADFPACSLTFVLSVGLNFEGDKKMDAAHAELRAAEMRRGDELQTKSSWIALLQELRF